MIPHDLLAFAKRTLLLGLGSASAFAEVNLPTERFPLGHPDLRETRTVKEIRPGLTHVHVVCGDLDAPAPKLRIQTEAQRDFASLAAVRSYFDKAGYAVREHRSEDGQWHWLTAGDFDTSEQARIAALKVPHPVSEHIANPTAMADWDQGPYSLHIVIVDPKQYNGKVVSEWSGKFWRSSPLELSRLHKAAVAINGSFFEFSQDNISGVPTGTSIVRGEWHHEPASDKRNYPYTLFIDNDAEGGIRFSIDEQDPPLPAFKWGGGKRAVLDGIDRMPKDDDLVAMRYPLWRNAQLSHGYPSHITAMQIGEGGILMPGSYFHGPGLVLMATGSKQAILKEALESGEPVEMDLRVPGRPGLNALMAPTVFIKDGQSMPYRSRLDRLPYTTIGADADGKIYLIVADGVPFLKPWSGPIGIHTDETNAVVHFLGLTNASNLDGGDGSTSMVIDGKVIGHFPDYHLTTEHDDDRRVGDAVLVIDNG